MKKGKGTMRRTGWSSHSAWTLAALVAVNVAVPACASEEDPNGGRDTLGGENTSGGTNPNGGTASTPEEEIRKLLDQRKTDYGEALRTASLKLADRLPTFEQIKRIENAADDNAKKVAYEAMIDEMIAAPEFSRAMIKFWKDTFRTGQTGNVANNVNRDGAPTFAAQLTVEGRSYTELFTATNNTCPTYDSDANTFTAAECALATNAIEGPTVGVLTDPGLQAQYFANMAFRRVRFVQETFVCSKFPAEFAQQPVPMGSGTYTAAMPFASITGKDNKADARIDFLDTKAVICANCHANLNHVAPLFLNWDENGALRDRPQVKVPLPGEPTAARTDYLPANEGLAWRLNKPLTDMASLGQAIAADPDVPRCAVNRVWNYAMSRGDIVNDLASVPHTVTQPFLDKFTAGGMKLKETIRDVFKSEDFTKF
jgi:Protein of unknown function (DUF1549)